MNSVMLSRARDLTVAALIATMASASGVWGQNYMPLPSKAVPAAPAAKSKPAVRKPAAKPPVVRKAVAQKPAVKKPAPAAAKPADAGQLKVAVPEDSRQTPKSLAEHLAEEMRHGQVNVGQSDAEAVQELIVKRNIPIKYSSVHMLMKTPNAFGQGAACTTCHSSQDPTKSYRGLDLSSCDGLRSGSTEEPKRAIFVPGKDPKREILGRRLRNNRMPLGATFSLPSDTPAFQAVRDWIAAGAPDDENFAKKIRPLFAAENAFGPETPACTTCHMSNQEPPSFHELDLSSHAGIMLGADSVAKGIDKATKVVIPGDPEASGLWQHLVEARMPPGIPPTEDRDHPNSMILFQWVKQGASCN